MKAFMLCGILLTGGALSAQVQLKQLTEMGTAVFDINKDGKGVHRGGYYDFETNTSSALEDGVGQTVSINDAGQVLGLYDDGAGNLTPGMKNAGIWSIFPTSAFDSTSSYTLYDISENGVYVVGQVEQADGGYWGFIYNTQTQNMKVLSSNQYEFSAAYSVNNSGIAVGWVDDLPYGTFRMAAYFTADGDITPFSGTEFEGAASGINENNIIVGEVDVNAFIYNIETQEFTTFEAPENYFVTAFSDVSDQGVVVGYAETYTQGQGLVREPMIYQQDLATQPIFIADLLTDLGVSFDDENFSGQGYRFSSDGRFVGGWTSGPAAMASGWVLDLADLFEEGTDDCIVEFEEGVWPITRVVIGDLDHSSSNEIDGTPMVEDFTEFVAHLEAGQTYDVAFEGNTNGLFTNSFTVFADWNQDGTFEGENEVYPINDMIYGSDGTEGYQAVGQITVPADALLGQTKLRVLKIFGSTPTIEPCGTFVYGGQAEDYTLEVTTDMNTSDNELSTLSVYPNPVKDVLNITSKKSVKSFEAYNMAGKKVMSGKVDNSQINVNALTPGTYVFKVTLEGGQVETFKIIKK